LSDESETNDEFPYEVFNHPYPHDHCHCATVSDFFIHVDRANQTTTNHHSQDVRGDTEINSPTTRNAYTRTPNVDKHKLRNKHKLRFEHEPRSAAGDAPIARRR
jgi:hypothetical protein